MEIIDNKTQKIFNYFILENYNNRIIKCVKITKIQLIKYNKPIIKKSATCRTDDKLIKISPHNINNSFNLILVSLKIKTIKKTKTKIKKGKLLTNTIGACSTI